MFAIAAVNCAPFAVRSHKGLPRRVNNAATGWRTAVTKGACQPLNVTNAEGTLAGHQIALIDRLTRRIKAKSAVIAQEWNGVIPNLPASSDPLLSRRS